MTITTTQKIIKIGTSKGVTIAPKDLKALHADVGDEIEIILKPIDKTVDGTAELVALTQSLITRHKKALDNLSQR